MKKQNAFSLSLVMLGLIFLAALSAFQRPAAASPRGRSASFAATGPLLTPFPQVVGGTEAAPGAWPWMAALVDATEPDAYQGQLCGGSLVAPQWVLTAAHCVAGASPPQIEVVLARQKLNSTGGERLGVVQIDVHPDFDPQTAAADLALLRMASPSGQPQVNLLEPGAEALAAPGTLATILGWGSTAENGDVFPQNLQQAEVPLVSNVDCSQVYPGAILESMLCAGYAEGGVDACQGDSGGPLIVPAAQPGGWLQAGIVSWGEGCAQPGYYGVYTRLSSYAGWIQAQAGIVTDPTATPTLAPTGIPLTRRLYLPSVNRWR